MHEKNGILWKYYYTLQGSLPAILMFNVRKSATKYDEKAKKYQGFSTGGNILSRYIAMLIILNNYLDLDGLIKEYKMSITVGEEGWTSVVTISSTMGNIDSMFQCHEKLLEKLFRSTLWLSREVSNNNRDDNDLG